MDKSNKDKLENQKGNVKLQSLTPSRDVDISHYEDVLDSLFDDENKDIKNIAISGAYGSGKSSLLASYEEYSKKNFLNISLACFNQSAMTFNLDDENDNSQNSPLKDEALNINTLEGKILNQIIHQIDAEKIPLTNFKVNKIPDIEKIKSYSLVILALIVSVIFILNFSSIVNFINNYQGFSCIKVLLSLFVNHSLVIMAFLFAIFVTGWIIFESIKAMHSGNFFGRISLQGNEVELFKKDEDSYFDKYLNEVLYILENSGADAIVFEDIDRFQDISIFERLREINTLVNIHLSKKEKSLLKFFYLLRDDMFISKDRTKFFDLIIPVIPVIDSSNAHEKFIEFFMGDKELEQSLGVPFLKDICFYIDDMRLLKNIYNEFLIYNNRINKHNSQARNLNLKKLLAIIVYKNIFPLDFANLQLGRGVVHLLFSQKNQFVKNRGEKLKSKIEQFASEKESLELYIATNLSKIDELIDFLTKMPKGGYNNEASWRYNLAQEVLGMLGTEKIEIWQATAEKIKTNKVATLDEEIKKYQGSLSELTNKEFSEILSDGSSEDFFSFSDSSNSLTKEDRKTIDSHYFPLLRFLLTNGYIGENYSDYISYFYATTLSFTDKEFISSIKEKSALPYYHKLEAKNINNILSNLEDKDFRSKEILNFDLLSYLIANKTKYKGNLKVIFNLLYESKNINFIYEYLASDKDIIRFISTLSFYQANILKDVLIPYGATKSELLHYVELLLTCLDDEALRKVNIDRALTQYISNNASFLGLQNIDSTALITKIKELGVSFVDLSIDEYNAEILSDVYANDLYNLNFINIKFILKTFYEIENDDDIKHKNYSLILTQPETYFVDYVHDNMGEYIDIVLKNCEEKILDEDSAIKAVLTNDVVTPEQKSEYISKLKSKVISIDSINEELWESLFNVGAVGFTSGNLISYFNKSQRIDDLLISFINNTNDEFDKNFRTINIDKEIRNSLILAIVPCNAISTTKYIEIISKLGLYYNNFNYMGIDEDKITGLVGIGTVRLTVENLNFFRANYPQKVTELLAQNVDTYLESFGAANFVHDECVELLSVDSISDDKKIKLIKLCEKPISILRENFSPLIQMYILSYNFDPNDLPQLLTKYPQYAKEVQNKIFDLVVVNINEISEDNMQVPLELMELILKSEDISTATRRNILFSNSQQFSNVENEKLFKILNLGTFTKIFTSKRETFSMVNNENNRSILNELVLSNIIAAFHENEKNSKSIIVKIKE